MLDFDLAALYEVETRVLNQAVKKKYKTFSKRFYVSTYKKRMERMSSQIVMTYIQIDESQND